MFNVSRGPLSLLGCIALILILASSFACNRNSKDKVVAGPDTGNSVYSLNPPNGVLASNGTYSDFVKISWTAVPGAEAYTVFRTTSDSVSASDFIASNVNGYEYEDHSADLDVTYYYWVRAVNGNQLSALSGFATGFATRGHAGVEVPDDLDASDGDFEDKVDLVWSCSDPTVTFNVYRNTQKFAKTAERVASGLTDKTYTDTIEANIDYYYWVTASEGDLESYFGIADSGYAAKEDLYIQSLHAPSVGLKGGFPVSLAIVCRNKGRVDAGAFTVGFYFSTDDVFDSESDLKIANCDIEKLAADSYTIATGHISLKENGSDVFYVLAVADEFDEVEESDEDNNISVHAVTAYNHFSDTGKPDFGTTTMILYDMQMPKEATEISGVKSGSYLFMRFGFGNNSFAPVDPNLTVETSIVLSNDMEIDGNDTELGYASQPGMVYPEGVATFYMLPLDLSTNGYKRIFIPQHAPGLYYLGLFTESGNVVEEENEENNTMSWPIYIGLETPSPDLWQYEILELE